MLENKKQNPTSLGEWDWEKIPVQTDSLVGRAFAPTNIALAKYWGKRDLSLNLPQNSSLSVTLARIGSFTTVEFNKNFVEDSIYVDGQLQKRTGSFLKKAKVVLDLLRQRSNISWYSQIQTKNNFPTGAGLASSASGLAALTLAASHALKCDISKEELSGIARQGSGSASRSLFGGFVQWDRGEKSDGTDSTAHSLASEGHWPLRVYVVVVEEKDKINPSTDAMELTRKTSPYFSAWVEYAERNVSVIREQILARDFLKLAISAEENCFKMHASAQAATPPLLYWTPQTVEIIHKVWRLREKGYRLFFTIDAGPNVVIFTDDLRHEDIKKELGEVKIIESKVGEGAQILEP